MAAHEQVGDFVADRRASDGHAVAATIRQGGDLVSYFLRPDETVLTSIGGQTSADGMIETGKAALRKQSGPKLVDVEKAAWEENGQAWLDRSDPLLKIAQAGVQYAADEGHKLVLVVYDETALPLASYHRACEHWRQTKRNSARLRKQLTDAVVVAVGENHMPVISQQLGDKPYAIHVAAALPVYIVPDGKGQAWSTSWTASNAADWIATGLEQLGEK